MKQFIFFYGRFHHQWKQFAENATNNIGGKGIHEMRSQNVIFIWQLANVFHTLTLILPTGRHYSMFTSSSKHMEMERMSFPFDIKLLAYRVQAISIYLLYNFYQHWLVRDGEKENMCSSDIHLSVACRTFFLILHWILIGSRIQFDWCPMHVPTSTYIVRLSSMFLRFCFRFHYISCVHISRHYL